MRGVEVHGVGGGRRANHVGEGSVAGVRGFRVCRKCRLAGGGRLRKGRLGFWEVVGGRRVPVGIGDSCERCGGKQWHGSGAA